ncbi:hypothetical protein Tco_0617437 [Tanacetum coccineum]
MQQEERQLHSMCMERFEILMSRLNFGDTGLNYGFKLTFKRYFGEVHETFCQKMFQNVNQIQWQLENIISMNSFKKFIGTDPLTFRERLLQYLDGLNKTQESLVIKGAALEVNLVTEGVALEESLVTKDAEKILVDTVASDIEYADIRPSFDSDIVYEVHHDTFENVFANEIQSHEQPDSISNTYVVNENNENNSDIVFDKPNMDPDRGKEEHDYVDYEQQRVFFASLINNLKCDVKKYTKVNREAQQANALLTNKLKRYKEKEKYFAKEKTIETKYCKKIKLLNDKISNLKSQACQNDKTFTRENGKYDEYVQPLLKRKNELENKNQKFFKQINDLDNKLRKAGQTDQTL